MLSSTSVSLRHEQIQYIEETADDNQSFSSRAREVLDKGIEADRGENHG